MVASLLIIIPCYNEEQILNTTIHNIQNLYKSLIENNKISNNSKILFVDDGSIDNTWNIISNNSKNFGNIKGLKLSRNFGHQNALLAALASNINKFDLYITIDADLQDDINIIPDMIESNYQGNEIVYAVRNNRETDSIFKRKSAEYFYKIQKMLGIDIIENHADYRLISNKVLIELGKYKEINLFLRAIFPLIGFKSDLIYYKRFARTEGESKYSILRMLKFAADGITSFSIRPLRMIFILGLITFIITLFISIWIFIGAIFTNNTVPGWASTTLPIYFLGGIQLLSLGIIGEYIGKIYIESKARPRFVIEDEI